MKCNRYHWANILYTSLIVGCTICPSLAQAKSDVWDVMPMVRRGVKSDTAEIFRELLETELSKLHVQDFVNSKAPCDSIDCAIKEGKKQGADIVVFGSISILGKELVVSVKAVDVNKNAVISSHKKIATRFEELDDIAEQLALALQGRGDGTQLGNIVENDQRPDARRSASSGVGLRLGGLLPVNDGYAQGTPWGLPI